MDREWMRQQLQEFDAVAERYEQSQALRGAGDRTLRDQLHRKEPTITKILQALDPALVKPADIDHYGGVAKARGNIQRGLGTLTDMDEWATRLTAEAPTLAADQLHPWVWDAARTFWESKHFRAAVQAGASAINAHLQDKLGRRDVSDDKLIGEAFTDKPPEPGKPRLRVPGDQSSPTVQSQQRGALHLGYGCFFALRNPAAHETAELGEQCALEQLATLSVLARLVDDSEVLTQ